MAVITIKSVEVTKNEHVFSIVYNGGRHRLHIPAGLIDEFRRRVPKSELDDHLQVALIEVAKLDPELKFQGFSPTKFTIGRTCVVGPGG